MESPKVLATTRVNPKFSRGSFACDSDHINLQPYEMRTWPVDPNVDLDFSPAVRRILGMSESSAMFSPSDSKGVNSNSTTNLTTFEPSNAIVPSNFNIDQTDPSRVDTITANGDNPTNEERYDDLVVREIDGLPSPKRHCTSHAESSFPGMGDVSNEDKVDDIEEVNVFYGEFKERLSAKRARHRQSIDTLTNILNDEKQYMMQLESQVFAKAVQSTNPKAAPVPDPSEFNAVAETNDVECSNV